jgi:N-acetylglucosaminyldiphosphoundecaprenol N-acetyl-beta-D-mannosaminyltransferase
MRKYWFSRVLFFDGSAIELLELCSEVIRNDQEGMHVHFLNNHVMQISIADAHYLDILNESNSAVVIDGKSIAIIMRIMLRSKGSPAQIRGSDFMKLAMNSTHQFDFIHYFLGGDPVTLEALLVEAEKTSKIGGGFSPPFTPVENWDLDKIAKNILESGANILWIGLGTPKQDFVAQKLAQMTRLPTLCVGAAFDFYSGNKSESPRVMSYIGLEWLFRLFQEPRRLWKRYLIGNWSILRVISRQLKSDK